MEGDHIELNHSLTPLAWLYGFAISVRNLLFEMNVLKSRSFSVPVISVGNITVGGSGKTPHVEYLIDLLHSNFKTAVLSRGYKRQSHGFQLADSHSEVADIGDEPYQMLLKYPDIHIAVDANRCHGIEELMIRPETKALEVILLDDAFQHRYVKPGLNILLTDYHRIMTDDKLLPVGRLREPISGKDRADIVIITKCPRDLKPMEYRVLQRNINLMPCQKLFFSTIRYLRITPVFMETKPLPQPNLNIAATSADYSESTPQIKLPHILLITGIASPKHLIEHLTPYCKGITSVQYADHHMFTPSDAESINFAYKMLKQEAIILTTEKDAMRLQHLQGLSTQVRENIYYLPIKIEFLLGGGDVFNQTILDYVLRQSKRNSTMATSTNAEPTTTGNSPWNRTGTTR